jgi:hypothetical protein
MTQPAFRNRSGDADGTVPGSDHSGLSDEDRSKDKFYNELAALSNSMIAAHGRDFAMGALILAARFIAENKAFTKESGTKESGTTEPGIKDPEGAACCGGTCQSNANQNHDHAHHKS